MLETVAIPAINRLLRANTWALEKLRPHAGKSARLACPPFDLHVAVTPEGDLTPAAPGSEPDVTVSATPGVALRLAARDADAWKETQVSGDMHFAAAIDEVRRNVSWDYEEDLSRVFGDVAAHRMAGALREIDRWGRSALTNFGRSVAEYATHEQPVVASAEALESFSRDVDQLRDDAARLQERVAALRERLGRR